MLNFFKEIDVLYSYCEWVLIFFGIIVRFEIFIWFVGMVFEVGEGIVLNILGYDMCFLEIEMCCLKEFEDENIGWYYLYIGGLYDSYLIIFVIKG